MVRKYVCPHCAKISIIQGEAWELDYSSPVLTCTKCQKEFLREKSKEIAVSKVSFDDKLPISLWSIGILLAGVVMLLLSFHFDDGVTIFRPKNLIIGAIFVVASFSMAINGIKNFKKKHTYLKEESQRSQARCADASYVDRLTALGYKIKK